MNYWTFCLAVAIVLVVAALIITSERVDDLERQFGDLVRIVGEQTNLTVAQEQADRWTEACDSIRYHADGHRTFYMRADKPFEAVATAKQLREWGIQPPNKGE